MSYCVRIYRVNKTTTERKETNMLKLLRDLIDEYKADRFIRKRLKALRPMMK